MAFAMPKARIGVPLTSVNNVNEILVTRQERNGTNFDGEIPAGFVVQNGRLIPYWYSKEGLIIKWSVFLGLMVLFTLYFLVGYIHAKRRLKKGLKPLGYHRFLLSRADLARVDPAYAYPPATYTNYAGYTGPGYYGQPMPMPVYDPNRPPMYQGGPPMPPPNAGKVDPAQEYSAPAGPPPGNSGNAENPFADPRK